MAFTELQRKIVAVAAAHDGLFLLRRRYGMASIPPSQIDLEYDACDGLVERGHAKFLRGSSAPGIELTGKPE